MTLPHSRENNLLQTVSQSVPESFKVPIEINGTPVTMELDTGAAVSLVR